MILFQLIYTGPDTKDSSAVYSGHKEKVLGTFDDRIKADDALEFIFESVPDILKYSSPFRPENFTIRPILLNNLDLEYFSFLYKPT